MLLFISHRQHQTVHQSPISIHLMLLFILFVTLSSFLSVNFNTSHVTVYRNASLNAFASSFYFNTSHVTVYRRLFHLCIYFCFISIHLMLLFIISGFIIPRVKRHFNTSHVTVYLYFRAIFFISSSYFNTSHVTVYLCEYAFGIAPGRFQYISCYCLSEYRRSSIRLLLSISIHLMLLFILHHRLLYYCFLSFQYISCYCLSLRHRKCN